jgi:hypothetical protein
MASPETDSHLILNMNVKPVYKLSLLLPIIVPVLFAPTLLFFKSLSESTATVLMIIITSLVYGGVPYLILVGLLLRWMRDKNEAQIRRALILSPLFMIVIFQLVAGVYIALFSEARPRINQFIGSLIILTPFILLFGYAYVGIAFGLIRVWKKRRLCYNHRAI